MPKEKKRLSKSAKAAQKLLNESKLLAATRAAADKSEEQQFKSSAGTLRTNTTAIKPRPDKKRG